MARHARFSDPQVANGLKKKNHSSAVSAGLGAGGAVLGAVGGFIPLIISIANELMKKDHTFRVNFMVKPLEVLEDKYEDHNFFIYQRFQDDFKWHLDDESTMITTLVSLKRKDVPPPPSPSTLGSSRDEAGSRIAVTIVGRTGVTATPRRRLRRTGANMSTSSKANPGGLGPACQDLPAQ